MATGDAHWRTGVITVPGSTGTQAITGLGGKPKAVFFYGTNWNTEDTAVTTTGTGVSRGMAAPLYSSPSTILAHANFVSPAGDQSRMTGGVINSLTTAGTGSVVDVAATLTSFDSDGFTLSYSVVASGRKVIYVALMDVTDCGGYFGAASTTISPGWKAGASLLHGSWSPGGGADYTSGNEAGQYYGGAAYPGAVGGSTWFGAGLAATAYPTHLNQRITGLYTQAPATVVTQGGHFIGPFVTVDNVVAYPSGGSLHDFTIQFGTDNGGMVTFWSDESSQTGNVTPAQSTGGTATVSGLPFRPGLVLFYSISNEAAGTDAISPIPGAVGMSVATRDFQWCAIVDAHSQGSFQSLQRGFADTCDATSVHAGTVDLTSDGFVLHTEEDDVTASSIVWHAFGHPQPVVIWMPSIYRRIYGTSLTPPEAIAVVIAKSAPETTVGAKGSGTSYLFTGFVLLENGDQIILEDGSGFLLL